MMNRRGNGWGCLDVRVLCLTQDFGRWPFVCFRAGVMPRPCRYCARRVRGEPCPWGGGKPRSERNLVALGWAGVPFFNVDPRREGRITV